MHENIVTTMPEASELLSSHLEFVTFRSIKVRGELAKSIRNQSSYTLTVKFDCTVVNLAD